MYQANTFKTGTKMASNEEDKFKLETKGEHYGAIGIYEILGKENIFKK